MKQWAGLLALGCCAAANASAPDAEYDPRNTQVGSYLQIGLPLLGVGLTYLLTGHGQAETDSSASSGLGLDDGAEAPRGLLDWNRMNGSPRHDFFLAFGRMEVITYGLKYSIDEQRPNGQPHSFPSGHTSASFMGAEFIRKEYGWWFGAPAYAAASYVGWTRQQSRNHYSRDVFAGAAIGILSNHDISDFTTRAGDVHIGVSPISTGFTRCSADDAALDARSDSSNPRDLPLIAPGFKLELDF
jgi:hypothetical protein